MDEQPVNIATALASFDEHWSPKIIAALNGQHVKLAKFQGEFVWHAHHDADELFLVLEGEFTMEFRDRAVPVRKGELIVVHRGIEHRPVAAQECSVLLFEPAGTVSTGDASNDDRSSEGEWISE
ncbi:MAG: cupin domain-containing protein [Phycisphaerales bacterium]|nr:cupin domain-containing protein [Phycisphaerales bacterium]